MLHIENVLEYKRALFWSSGSVTCEVPNKDIRSFNGHFESKRNDESLGRLTLGTDNILLRGSRLRNTQLVVAFASILGSVARIDQSAFVLLDFGWLHTHVLTFRNMRHVGSKGTPFPVHQISASACPRALSIASVLAWKHFGLGVRTCSSQYSNPTQVMVEREEGHRFCWMMRDSGYDTRYYSGSLVDCN